MAIDLTSKYYPINYAWDEWGEYQFFLPCAVAMDFVEALISGTVNGWSIAGLFQNDSDYITSLDYYPIDLTKFFHLSGTTTWPYPTHSIEVGIGKKLTTFKAYSRTNEIGSIYDDLPVVELFSTTLTRIYNNYLDFSPYTKIQLYVPFFPLIDLDPNLLYGNTIKGYVSLDSHTGKLNLLIYSDTILVCEKTVTIKIPLSFGSTNQNEIMRNNILSGIELTGSLASLIAGAYTGNGFAVAGGISLGTKAMSSLITNNVERLVGYKGTDGNRGLLYVDKSIYFIVEYPKNPYLPDNALKGSPCNRTLALSSLSGYQEMEVISFKYDDDSDVYQNEVDEIINLLKNGVIM